MIKIPKQAYTTEFKELAIKRTADLKSIVGAAKERGLRDQTLRNWIKASAGNYTAVENTIDLRHIAGNDKNSQLTRTKP